MTIKRFLALSGAFWRFLGFLSDIIIHTSLETGGSIMTGRSLCNP